MKSTNAPCILCGQPVEISGFALDTKDGEKGFCCEGCLSVYKLLNPKKLLPTPKEKKK